MDEILELLERNYALLRFVSIEKEQLNYASTCPCESHPTRTYVDRPFAFKLDALYELSFGENAFTRAYHELQKLTGSVQFRP